LKIAPKVSTMSVHRALKNELKPHLSKYWKIPPDGCAAFVACMEDVLDVYHAPYDPQFPLVCMDESNKQLVGEVHAPLAAAPGRGQIVDHEYVRIGVAEIFLEVEPLSGRRHVDITEQRTRKDWAMFVKGMLDERYPPDFWRSFRAHPDSYTPHSFAETVEKDHGRLETRRCYVFDQLECLDKPYRWQGLRSFAVLESERTIGDNTTHEQRFYISILAADAQTIANAVRSHWSIENRLHWCMDVSLNGDHVRA